MKLQKSTLPLVKGFRLQFDSGKVVYVTEKEMLTTNSDGDELNSKLMLTKEEKEDLAAFFTAMVYHGMNKFEALYDSTSPI